MATNTNCIWRDEWSRDRWRLVTLKGKCHDPNTLEAQYLENCWRCKYLATIANYSAARQYSRLS